MKEKTCVVTGSASGVGRATAVLLGQLGATVIGVDLDGPGGEQTAALVTASGGTALFVHGDVADEKTIAAAQGLVRHTGGHLAMLFNNAAEVVPDEVDTATADVWNRLLAVNVTAPMRWSQAFAPALGSPPPGAIVNHSSIDGILGNPHFASYSVSKSALEGLTRVMVHTYGRIGIRVNSIVSGNLSQTTSSTRWRDTGLDGDANLWAARQRSVLEETPLRRVGTVEDAAQLAVFLASDAARFVSGAAILLTGGRGVLTPGTTRL